MKYIVKVEIAVYESDGDLDDVLRTHLQTTIKELEPARELGERLMTSILTTFDPDVCHYCHEPMAGGPRCSQCGEL